LEFQGHLKCEQFDLVVILLVAWSNGLTCMFAPKMQVITGHFLRLYLEKPTNFYKIVIQTSYKQKLSFKKSLQKSTLTFKGGMKLVIQSIFVVN
jgi:hypothetical protein